MKRKQRVFFPCTSLFFKCWLCQLASLKSTCHHHTRRPNLPIGDWFISWHRIKFQYVSPAINETLPPCVKETYNFTNLRLKWNHADRKTVTPLPSSYKVDTRGWRRRENSNVFKYFCIWSENWKGQMQKTKQNNKPTTNKRKPNSCWLPVQHRWLCILQPLWPGVGFMPSQRVRHAAAVTSQSFQSANRCFNSPPHATHRPSTCQSNRPEPPVRRVVWPRCYLERPQYASHALNTQEDADGEESGMMKPLLVNRYFSFLW